MAEIRIEKKKPIWPWILGAILLIAIIAYFMWDDDKEAQVADDARQEEQNNNNQNTAATYDTTADDYRDDTANTNTTGSASGNAVEDYRMHIRNDDGKMGLDHNYTHQALTKLSSGISYTASQKNYDVKADLSKVETWADAIQKDPMSLKHADKIQNGLKEVLTSFQNIQKKHYPGLEGEIDDLEDLYEDWDASKPTLEQKQTIKSFFDEAGEILAKMEKENNK